MEFNKYKERGAYHWKLWRDLPNSQYSQHAKHLASWVEERPVLDVGCGDGLITHLLGDGALGIDNCELAIKLAHEHGVRAILFDLYLLDFIDEWRAILLGDVIEHLEFPEKALRRIHKALRPGGYLYISTPPKSAKLHDAYHYREYTPQDLVKEVEPHGFILVGKILVKPEWVEMYAKFQKI